MSIQANTIEGFFAATQEREADLRQVDQLIKSTVPEMERSLFSSPSITMLGYGVYHYTYASGHKADWPVIGLANQKNYISLYICARKDGKYLAEHYGNKLGKVHNGKSCIRFKRFDDLNLEEVNNIVRDAAKWLENSQTEKA